MQMKPGDASAGGHHSRVLGDMVGKMNFLAFGEMKHFFVMSGRWATALCVCLCLCVLDATKLMREISVLKF